MPITSYLSDDQVKPCSNLEMQNIVDELFLKTSERWFIQEKEMGSSIFDKWFSKKPLILYSLYKNLGGNEWQVINFYMENSKSSICITVPIDVIYNFLMGYLSALSRN